MRNNNLISRFFLLTLLIVLCLFVPAYGDDLDQMMNQMKQKQSTSGTYYPSNTANKSSSHSQPQNSVPVVCDDGFPPPAGENCISGTYYPSCPDGSIKPAGGDCSSVRNSKSQQAACADGFVMTANGCMPVQNTNPPQNVCPDGSPMQANGCVSVQDWNSSQIVPPNPGVSVQDWNSQ